MLTANLRRPDVDVNSAHGALTSPSLPPLRDLDSPELLTLEEAAVTAGVSVRTLARYRASGQLEVTRIGRRVYCTIEAVRVALVRTPVRGIAQELLEPNRTMTVPEWWRRLIRLAEAHPALESMDRLTTWAHAAERALPSTRVATFTIGQLRRFVEGLEPLPARTDGPDLIQLLLTFPDPIPLPAAFGRLRAAFGW